MKKIRMIILAAIALLTLSVNAQDKGKVVNINEKEFLDYVFDYKGDSAVVKAKRLAVVDFWAPWCGPCRRLAPVIEELSVEYNGKVDFYKLNIDDNPRLAQDLGINSIPFVVFFPTDGSHPMSQAGLAPADLYREVIDALLNKEAK